MAKLTVNDIDFQGKRVLTRVDFNVPMAEQDGAMVINDDTRIRATLPTLKLMTENGAKVILTAHLGRPKGKRVPSMSLRPVADKLAGLIGKPVAFSNQCVGQAAEDAVAKLEKGGLLLLENVRYHSEEEANDPTFAQQLACDADVFVNDAFGAAHRAHASTAGVADVLKARDGEGEDIPLQQLADGSSQFQLLRDFNESGEFRYELHLEDADERTNRFPSLYVFNVLENAAPALKFEAPTGDTEVSAIEEMRLQGVVRDDFGLADAGIGYQLAGEEPQYLSLAAADLSTNKLAVAHVLRMEDLGVEVGQVVSYFLWADDRDRDGKLRRGFSDLFFATVRPFEEIFRQNRSATEGMRQQQQQGEGGEQGGEQQQSIANLLDSQKDIISATWNIKRRKATDEKLAEDIQVVADSQGELLGMLEQASALLQDSESGGQAYQANEAMQAAADNLAKAKDSSGDALGQALSAAIMEEQTALQHLQRLRENEFRVSRQQAQQQRQQQQGRGNSNRAQRQLDQLDMQDTQNNYELESKAERQRQQAQQQGERAEQLQTLNRLKELSRRQSDLNERLQELQGRQRAIPRKR